MPRGYLTTADTVMRKVKVPALGELHFWGKKTQRTNRESSALRVSVCVLVGGYIPVEPVSHFNK